MWLITATLLLYDCVDSFHFSYSNCVLKVNLWFSQLIDMSKNAIFEQSLYEKKTASYHFIL